MKAPKVMSDAVMSVSAKNRDAAAELAEKTFRLHFKKNLQDGDFSRKESFDLAAEAAAAEVYYIFRGDKK